MHVAFERVFFLKKVSENKKTAVLIERKISNCDLGILNFYCHRGIPETN